MHTVIGAHVAKETRPRPGENCFPRRGGLQTLQIEVHGLQYGTYVTILGEKAQNSWLTPALPDCVRKATHWGRSQRPYRPGG